MIAAFLSACVNAETPPAGDDNPPAGGSDGSDVGEEDDLPEPYYTRVTENGKEYVYFGHAADEAADAGLNNALTNLKASGTITADADGFYTYNDKKYVCMIAKEAAAGRKLHDGAVIEAGKEYFFEYSPVKWRILEITDGVALMLAENVLGAAVKSANDRFGHLFGDDVFREVCVPWTRRFCRTFLERGLPCIWHPHGDMFSEGRDLGPEVIDTGCTCFHFAEGCDLAVLRRSLGGRVPLMGGTDIVPTLMTGDEEAIISETERFLFSLEGVPHVFSASCSLHRGVPLRGIKAMTDTVRQLNSGRV